MISSYINYCTDICLDTKEVKLYQNSTPRVTKEDETMSREKQTAFKEYSRQRMKEMPKEKHKNIKTDKTKSAAKVEDNVQQSGSRLHWGSTQTITGYKRKKGACLQAAAANSKLANDLNVFYTRFDQRDFCTQQTQAVNGESTGPATLAICHQRRRCASQLQEHQLQECIMARGRQRQGSETVQ